MPLPHTITIPPHSHSAPCPRRRALLGAALLCLLPAGVRPAAAAPQPGRLHEAWDGLLQAHVHWSADGTASTVDYVGLRARQAQLQAYLDALSAVPTARFEGWTQPEREAFLINAYNAFTVQLLLNAPTDTRSIRELGSLFRSPWKQRFFELLGARRHLDEVEHELLRGAPDYRDARIHFAVNCASIGCPALRPQAYRGATLEAQLADQTQRFLADRSRNAVDPARRRLTLSPIFSWYREDFERHSGSLPAFLASHAGALGLDAAQAADLAAGQWQIRFGDYDWGLNGVLAG